MTEEKTNKLLAFEYVLLGLTNWYISTRNLKDYSEFNSGNDLSKLKVIKLHFFVTAINSDKNKLLSVFNKFYAMPYGHVESDIYNSLNELNHFNISTRSLSISSPLSFSDSAFEKLDKDVKSSIDNSLESLKAVNSNLILYNALDLVELSHTWFSWKSMYSFAKANHRSSELIPPSIIQNENKHFELVF